MRLGNKTYEVELVCTVNFNEDQLPDHLLMMPEERAHCITSTFRIQADRAYIAEYGMRFYRQGVVFLILPHSAYKSIRLIECDELKEKMEAGNES